MYRAVAVLVVTIISFGVLLFQSYDSNNKLTFNIIMTIAVMVLLEKITDVFRGIEDDRNHQKIENDRQKIAKFFDELPLHLKDAHDVVCFKTRLVATEYTVRSAQRKDLVYIRNTILRYNMRPTTAGAKSSRNEVDVAYHQWMKARVEALVRGCEITEIISKYLSKSDPIRNYVAEAEAASKGYNYHKIDDVVNPMVQMTIFYYTDDTEVIFGWWFPGAEEGRAFLSKNPLVVEFFEKYFALNYQKTEGQCWSDEPTRSDEPKLS